MPRIISLFMVLALGGSVIYSCQSAKKEKQSTEQIRTLDPNTTWTQVAATISDSCEGAACHSSTTGGSSPAFTAAGFQTAFERVLFRAKSKESPMPPAAAGRVALSAADLALLEGWRNGGYKTSNDTTTTTGEVTWEGNIRGALEASCVSSGCHSTTSVQYTVQISYIGVKEKFDAVLSSVEAGRMPKAGSGKTFSADQIAQLKKWRDGAYKERIGDTTTTIDKTDFQDDIRPLLESNCSGAKCHGQGGDGEDKLSLDYGDSQGPKSRYQDIITSVTADKGSIGFMPKGKDPLSQSDIDKLRKWQSDGYPENDSGTTGGTDNTNYSCSRPYGTSGVRFEEFKRDVDDMCSKCHGPDQDQLKGGGFEASYGGIAANVGAVIRVLSNGKMPPETENFSEGDRDNLLQRLREWAGDNCPR
ncbi:MAG: hypothetical protein AB7T49_13380 [Oligoflexales bacterium]